MRYLLKCYVRYLSLSILVSFISPGLFSADRFNILTFTPHPDSGSFFHIMDTSTLYQLQFNVGSMVSYNGLQLKERYTDVKIVDSILEEHFFGAFGVTDWMEIGFSAPLIFKGYFYDVNSTSNIKKDYLTGDAVAMMKFRILDRESSPIGLAIAPFVTIPIGDERYFLGEGGVSGGGDLILDAKLGKYALVALNLGMRGGEKVSFRDIDKGNCIMRLGGGVSVKPSDFLSISGEVFTESPTNHLFANKVSTPVEAAGGVTLDIAKTGLKVYAGGGAGIIRGAGSPNWRFFGGLSYRLMNSKYIAMDTRRAGVTVSEAAKKEEMFIQLKEKCPSPDKYDPNRDDPACPKYYELKEMSDLVVKCPSNPADFNPEIHDQSCPKVYTLNKVYSPAEVRTIYMMSFVDLSLRCPDTVEEYNPNVHDPACPKYYDLKLAAETMMKCPSNPADYDPNIHDPACPKVYEIKEEYGKENWVVVKSISIADSDSDGVADVFDRCPATPGEAERDGCPKEKAVISGEILKTAQPIEFAFNSVDIKKSMIPVLFDVVEAMAENKNLRLRVLGYADILGTKRANLSVSKTRAERVRDYLVKIGADPSRLEAVGMGASDFVASNATPEGRARNRRVVFAVIAK